MNPRDTAVSQILARLKDVQPSPGFEERILCSLEAANKSTDCTEPTSALYRARVYGILRWAAVAALVILTVFLGLRPRNHNSSATTSNTPLRVGPLPLPSKATTPAAVSAPNSMPVGRRFAIARETEANTQPVRQARIEDNTPLSHPAPPLPLTAQERILLRYARYGRSEDLAQISNERKAAQEDQENAQFQAFFKPPVHIGESE